MTNPVAEPIDETADELWADDELSDEALDRAAGYRTKGTAGTYMPPCILSKLEGRQRRA